MMHARPARFLAAVAIAALAGVGTIAAAASASAAPATASVSAAAALQTKKVAKPKLSKQPKSQTIVVGKKATLAVKAKGKGLTYQWYVKKGTKASWKKISGKAAKKASYKVTTKAALDGYSYRVVVANTGGKVTSKAAKLTVVYKPKITTQPKTLLVTSGEKATFSVAAKGNKLTYQWQSSTDGKKWTNLKGKTKAKLTVAAKTKLEGTQYQVIVKNTKGKTTSKAAVLLVDSTLSDPFALGTVVPFVDWDVWIYPELDTVENATTTQVSALVAGGYYGKGDPAPETGLTFAYLSGKKSYQAQIVGPEQTDEGYIVWVVTVSVPTKDLKNGTWKVVETATDLAQYVKGL